MVLSSALLAAALGLSACDPGPPAPATPASAASTAAPAPAPPTAADRWLGTWTGPEGTSLQISAATTGYLVVITDLDGPRRFAASAEGDRLVFDRDGKRESLHAGNGVDTGMKWLADKTHCLVVKPGEGFCRAAP